MSASVASPYMFRSYTWPSSGDVPCTMLLSALLFLGTRVCGRIFAMQSVIVKHYIAEYTATDPSTQKQQDGKQHCKRNIPWKWSIIWPKHVGWHNRRRHSNALKSDCVLVCILKYSAWVGLFKQCIQVCYFRLTHCSLQDLLCDLV
jgi:hypothetical protein